MRPVIVPDANVLAGMKALADLYEAERSAREALEKRVEALEAASRPGSASIPEYEADPDWQALAWTRVARDVERRAERIAILTDERARLDPPAVSFDFTRCVPNCTLLDCFTIGCGAKRVADHAPTAAEGGA